jgi:hypothetical protein
MTVNSDEAILEQVRNTAVVFLFSLRMIVHDFCQRANREVENLIGTSHFPLNGATLFYFENMTGSALLSSEPATVPITYIEADGTERIVQAKIGSNLLDTAHDNGVELEGTKVLVLVMYHNGCWLRL